MGILPLQFKPGESAASLGLTGREVYSVDGPRRRPDAPPDRRGHRVPRPGLGRRWAERRFDAIARLDGPIDVEYYLAGGILPAVLRRLATEV